MHQDFTLVGVAIRCDERNPQSISGRPAGSQAKRLSAFAGSVATDPGGEAFRLALGGFAAFR